MAHLEGIRQELSGTKLHFLVFYWISDAHVPGYASAATDAHAPRGAFTDFLSEKDFR